MSRTVLVVDDAAFVRGLIRRILVREGYDVHEAVNGRDAVEKYAEIRPDLVTLDVNMPEMNGLEALKAIRVHDPSARVIIVSAIRSEPIVSQAMDAGAAEYLAKPFQPSRIVDAVRRCLYPVAG